MSRYDPILKDEKWSHIKDGFWLGANSVASNQVLEGASIPTIHLQRAGSNSCISGFRDPAEAREFREEAGLGDCWHLVDLREDRTRYVRSTLELARRNKLEEIIDAHEFDHVVADMSGWLYDGSDTFSRPVFLEVSGQDSLEITFTVTFRANTPEDWVISVDQAPGPLEGGVNPFVEDDHFPSPT